MNILLDTHVWIWSQEAPENIGPRAHTLLGAVENVRWICPVSTLEVARLIAAGRLRFERRPEAWIEDALRFLKASTIPLSHETALEAYRMTDFPVRDPIDRVLVAAARTHGCHLMSADQKILAYNGVSTLDARK